MPVFVTAIVCFALIFVAATGVHFVRTLVADATINARRKAFAEARALTVRTPFTFEHLQREILPWQQYNFDTRRPEPDLNLVAHPLIGLGEELGELCHAHLKQAQGIRGDARALEAKGRDAVGDIVIYLADYCNARGWSLQDIVETTWGEVCQRDWVKFPENGRDK